MRRLTKSIAAGAIALASAGGGWVAPAAEAASVNFSIVSCSATGYNGIYVSWHRYAVTQSSDTDCISVRAGVGPTCVGTIDSSYPFYAQKTSSTAPSTSCHDIFTYGYRNASRTLPF